MSDIELFRFRAGEGLERDIANAVLDALTYDEPVGDAIVDALVQNALTRYSDKISAMLRRGGFDVQNEEPLTVETVRQVLEDAMGYDVSDLSIDNIMGAVDKMAAERLSAALGVPIGSVLNLQTELENAAIEAFQTGAAGLVSAGLYRRAREAVTWQRAGVDKKAVQNWKAQRKYRQNNVWSVD